MIGFLRIFCGDLGSFLMRKEGGGEIDDMLLSDESDSSFRLLQSTGRSKGLLELLSFSNIGGSTGGSKGLLESTVDVSFILSEFEFCCEFWFRVVSNKGADE